MQGKAADNVWAALLRGDVITSRWVLSALAEAQGSRVSGLGSLVGYASKEAAEAVVEAAMAGRISLEIGDQMMKLIERQAALGATSEIAELRELAQRLLGEASKTIEGVAQEQQPAWLKLRSQAPGPAPTHPGNKTPAE